MFGQHMRTILEQIVENRKAKSDKTNMRGVQVLSTRVLGTRVKVKFAGKKKCFWLTRKEDETNIFDGKLFITLRTNTKNDIRKK
ncbi:hypothetical protein RUM43_015025 [Polyplax serrata]|uniref:Uncharacterized protein n=1 Tax=Polyplax serrata TaxID=468196 RepID=A0AAN8P3U7_POLSC